MKIHHIGYLVKNIDKAIDEFKLLGFKLQSNVTYDDNRKISICFMSNESVDIELISSIDKTSVVSGLHKKIGNAPYHICYECSDIKKELQIKIKQGYMVVKEPEQAKAINDQQVAFLFNKEIGLIEIVES